MGKGTKGRLGRVAREFALVAGGVQPVINPTDRVFQPSWPDDGRGRPQTPRRQRPLGYEQAQQPGGNQAQVGGNQRQQVPLQFGGGGPAQQYGNQPPQPGGNQFQQAPGPGGGQYMYIPQPAGSVTHEEEDDEEGGDDEDGGGPEVDRLSMQGSNNAGSHGSQPRDSQAPSISSHGSHGSHKSHRSHTSHTSRQPRSQAQSPPKGLHEHRKHWKHHSRNNLSPLREERHGRSREREPDPRMFGVTLCRSSSQTSADTSASLRRYRQE